MNKKNGKRMFRAFAACALSAAMLLQGGCGKPQDEKVKVVVITKNDTLSFWKDVKRGAEDAGKELQIDVSFYAGAGDNDYATQIEAINKAIDDNADVIVIAPNGDTELEKAFQRAEAAGIKIININSKTSYSNISSFISSSDYEAGAVAGRNAVSIAYHTTNMSTELDNMKGSSHEEAMKSSSGAVVIIPHTAATADERVKGFTETYWSFVKQKLGLPEQATGEGVFAIGEKCSDRGKAKAEAMKLLSDPNNHVKTVYATNTVTTEGACDAVAELQLTDSVYVVGFNSSEDLLTYLRNQVADALILQNPYNMGYVSVNYARRIDNDEAVPIALDTGVTYVTPNTMNDEYVQLLLNTNGN